MKKIWIFLGVILCSFGGVFAGEYNDIKNYEYTILSQGEQIIQAYLGEQDLTSGEKDTKSDAFLGELLNATKEQGNIENIRILNEYYNIVLRKPIWEYPEIQNRIIPLSDDLSIKKNQYEQESEIYTPFYEIGTYNRNSAKTYAHTWVFSRNNNFNYYNGLRNCTNFVSQVLQAGGMTYIGTPSYLNKWLNSKWYYSNGGTS